MPELLLLLATLGMMVLWWYNSWRHGYWSSLGVPSAPCLPFLGNMFDSTKHKNVWNALDIIYKRYGGSKYCGRYEGFKPVLLIGDPEILKQVLVKDFNHFVDRRSSDDPNGGTISKMLSNKSGTKWKILRSIMTPTFSSGKIRNIFPLVCEKANTFVSYCLTDAATDPSLELKGKFGRYTMDTIASCAFGIECNSFLEQKPVFTEQAEAFLSMGPLKIARTLFIALFPNISYAIGINCESPETEFFLEIVVETLRNREAGLKQRGDFLDLILEAKAGTSELGTSAAPKHVLTDSIVVAQCIMFLLTGYDTTTSTLTFAAHLLAQNPKEQQRLRQELHELAPQNRDLTYEDVMEAKFLEACIKETLRLYPPGPVQERTCTKAYTLPGTDVIIRRDDLVQIPVWSLHHDPRYWPEPEHYRPDRFMPENKEHIKEHTFMPFGIGPRSCLGMSFALLTVKVALAKLVLATELQVAPGHHRIIAQDSGSVLRPKSGCKVLLKPFQRD